MCSETLLGCSRRMVYMFQEAMWNSNQSEGQNPETAMANPDWAIHGASDLKQTPALPCALVGPAQNIDRTQQLSRPPEG